MKFPALSLLGPLLVLAFLAESCGGSGYPAPVPTASEAPAAAASPMLALPPRVGQPSAPPDRDLTDLARRYRGLPADASRLAREAPYNYEAGASESFIVTNLEGPTVDRVSATLRLISDHAYFFVEDRLSVSARALQDAGSDFESKVYPTVTRAFGQEWMPGVDSDPHITILLIDLEGAAGYVSSSDQFPATVVPQSNQREILYIDASSLSASDSYRNSLLAHELQHLIHLHADPTEEAWVNEGLSEVAAEMLGAGTDGTGRFLASPDTQLNFWPESNTGVHYAKSHLFFRYLLERWGGRDQAKDLVGLEENGIEGVDLYLRRHSSSFLDAFADWLVANRLNKKAGPFAQPGLEGRVETDLEVKEGQSGEEAVSQFAANYIDVKTPKDGATFRFEGDRSVSIGVPEHDGAFWWSQRGDGIDSKLTREIDLSGVATATLKFWTWFDSENGWDYAYVSVSSDGGRMWKAVRGSLSPEYDPVGQAYGPGYTGQSGGWKPEEIDLTMYAGQKALLRFEYVTDDSVNLRGFAVDDIQIPEIGFQDLDGQVEGWIAEGFSRVDGPLEQGFLLQVIEEGGQQEVRRITIDAANRAAIKLEAPATIVIAGTTQGTTEPARYRWSLSTP